VKAIIFYQKKLESSVCVPRPLLFTREVEKKRKLIGRSLSLTRDRYTSGCGLDPLKESEHEAEFLKVLILDKNFLSSLFFLYLACRSGEGESGLVFNNQSCMNSMLCFNLCSMIQAVSVPSKSLG